MTVGVVGAGQLGRMLALAGYPLGLDFLFLDAGSQTPGGQLAPSLSGELGDPRLLAELARRSEVLTFDWENVSVPALRAATRGTGTTVAPPLRALATAQDRLQEKRCFERLGIATTRYAAVTGRASLLRAIRDIGLPGVLKTRRMGYDGKGQYVLRTAADLDAAWQALGGKPLLYEEFVDYDLEVSAIGVRGRRGEVALYPLSRNYHHEGILRLTLAPWPAPRLARQSEAALRRLLEDFRYVGVLTVEFFVHRGRLIANEMAPRVHNSGHWTIEGAVASQFENHLRAIAGWPLGSTAARGHAAMINFIGAVPQAASLLGEADLHLHNYGKDPRPGRKVGHCTVLADSAVVRDRRARALMKRVYPHLAGIP
ncbi:MAG TPA: 5-(carboxyamino)imidazole ribonucleotide synthase [Steroidobacteraceae bacterium]|nr:5-(carboxyamino)imidazole ribonucleotide synthase [Steroidobacteraceae bacterium]